MHSSQQAAGQLLFVAHGNAHRKVGLAGAKGTEQGTNKPQFINCGTTATWDNSFLFRCQGPQTLVRCLKMGKLIWQVLLSMSDCKSKSMAPDFAEPDDQQDSSSPTK